MWSFRPAILTPLFRLSSHRNFDLPLLHLPPSSSSHVHPGRLSSAILRPSHSASNYFPFYAFLYFTVQITSSWQGYCGSYDGWTKRIKSVIRTRLGRRRDAVDNCAIPVRWWDYPGCQRRVTSGSRTPSRHTRSNKSATIALTIKLNLVI